MRGQAPHEPGAHRRPMDGALLFACMLLAAEDFQRRLRAGRACPDNDAMRLGNGGGE